MMSQQKIEICRSAALYFYIGFCNTICEYMDVFLRKSAENIFTFLRKSTERIFTLSFATLFVNIWMFF